MQNWDHMCADCHSTNLREFDHATQTFSTSYSEMNVAVNRVMDQVANMSNLLKKKKGGEFDQFWSG